MSDRLLASYEEKRLDHGPYWTLEVSRSAAGAPGLFFTIRTQAFSPDDRDIAALNQEMTIVVDDGNEFLKPIIAWLKDGVIPDPRDVGHIECNCVPDLGPSHCHLCSKRIGSAVSWDTAHPSTTITKE